MMAIIIFSIIIILIIGYKLYHRFDKNYEKDKLKKEKTKNDIASIAEAYDTLDKLKIKETSEEINLKSAKIKREIKRLQQKIQEKENDNNATNGISK